MKEFYEGLMKLEPVKCVVCLEKFPSLKVDQAGVCSWCNTDKHIPKLCCAQNSMDPGPIPPELEVSCFITRMK